MHHRLEITAVSGQPIGPIFKDPAIQEECTVLVTNKHRNGSLNCIIVAVLASGTDGIFGRNLHASSYFQKLFFYSESLNYVVSFECISFPNPTIYFWFISSQG